MMPTDEELIDEIKSGSQAAMEVLVMRHYKAIFAYIYRRLGDYHLAYDLTQEVFIKMMKAIPTYRSKGKFKNWLLTIATNQCRDYFRSKGFREKEQEQSVINPIADEKGQVWDLLSKKVEREKVRNAISRLPAFQSEAIILRFYHDLKISEIAVITGAKESTVKSRLHQAGHKLKLYLEGEDLDEERVE